MSEAKSVTVSPSLLLSWHNAMLEYIKKLPTASSTEAVYQAVKGYLENIIGLSVETTSSSSSQSQSIDPDCIPLRVVDFENQANLQTYLDISAIERVSDGSSSDGDAESLFIMTVKQVKDTLEPAIDTALSHAIYHQQTIEDNNKESKTPTEPSDEHSSSVTIKREYMLLKMANDLAKIGMWEANLSKKTVIWDTRVRQIHAVKPEYIPNLEEGLAFYKEGWSRETITKVFTQCVETGKSFDEELILVDAQGQERWIRTIGIRDEESDDTVVFGLFQDIDKIKHTLQELESTQLANAENLKRLEIAKNSAEIGVWEYDIDNQSLIWDENMYQIYGIKEGEFEHAYEAWSTRLHPDDKERAEAEIEKAIENHSRFDTEFRIVKSDGSIAFIEAHAIFESNDNGKPKKLIGTNQDITEQINDKTELSNAVAKAEMASKAKSEFVASMSHEIRTPMNGVLGMLNILKRSKLSDDDNRRLEIATESATSLLSLINDILDFSKIESGKLELEKVNFDIKKTLHDTLRSLMYRAREKQLNLNLDMRKVTHRYVLGDPGRLRQILVNLVNNALKFTQKGQIFLTASSQQISDNRVQLSCSVYDTGIGIANEKLEHIFDSFSQADSSTTRKFGGTGLGLTICRQLVSLMGGSISAKSRPGKGSQFQFTIELDPADSKPATLQPIKFDGKHALIVDDNIVNRQVLRFYLSSLGIESIEASGPMEAITLVETAMTPIDYYFLDYEMPEKDGLELAREIFEVDRDAKIIMQASAELGVNRSELMGMGISGHIEKPLLEDDILKVLIYCQQKENDRKSTSPPPVDHPTTAIDINSEGAMLEAPGSIDGEKRVLLVEDNQINQIVFRETIDPLNLDCLIVGNGIEAIQALKLSEKEKPFDIIFMDCQMPVMDGYEATKQIRLGKAGSINQDAPIIALTANAMQGDQERCFDAGMTDYLSKPIEEFELERMLNKYCRIEANRLDTYLSVLSMHEFWELNKLKEKTRDVNALLAVARKSLSEAEEALIPVFENNDREGLVHELHTIAGMAASMRLPRLAVGAKILEGSVRVNKCQFDDPRFKIFDDVLQESLKLIEQELSAVTPC